MSDAWDEELWNRNARWPTAAHWGIAAVIVVAVHGGLVWLALALQPAAAPPAEEPPPAMMIELAPLAVAPEAEPEDVAPGPQMVEAQPDPTPPAPETPVEEKAQDVPMPEPEIKPPDLPKVEKADAALSLPPPPKPRPKSRKKPPPKEREAERKPVNPDRPQHRQTTAPPRAQAAHARTTAAPSAGAAAAPSVSPASWRGSLIAHLNRYKRFPSGASVGTAQVAFTIDRSGRVLSSRLIGSSGDGALDGEAVAMMRRASPVPAPPAGFGGSTISLAVPVRFNR